MSLANSQEPGAFPDSRARDRTADDRMWQERFSRDKERAREESKRRDQKYAGVEILATFEDGREERVIVRRASATRTIRQLEASPGLRSVGKVRRLTMEEFRAYHPPRRQRRRWQAKPATSPVVASTGPIAAAASTRTEAIAEQPSGIYAWEVLVRQLGRPRTMRVVCATEAGSIELVMSLDGVDAAVAIRPLSLEEYREAARG